MLEQILHVLIAGVHGGELELLPVKDEVVLAQVHEASGPGPQQSPAATAERRARRQRDTRAVHRAPLASARHARPRPRTLECPADVNERESVSL